MQLQKNLSIGTTIGLLLTTLPVSADAEEEKILNVYHWSD